MTADPVTVPRLRMRERLARATRDLHHRVEAAFALEARLQAIETYAALLGSLYPLHRALETALAALDWHGTGIDVAERRKTGWLAADLRDLGAPARPPTSELPPLPRLDTTDRGLGCLYVLEGSTLGGRLIRRRAADRLGVSDAWAGRYFGGYGTEVGTMWRDFVAALNRVDPHSARAEAVEQAARGTFRAFEACLDPRPGRRPGSPLPAREGLSP